MWSNFLGRFSLERECVDFWVKGGKDFELYEYLAFSLSVALLSLSPSPRGNMDKSFFWYNPQAE